MIKLEQLLDDFRSELPFADEQLGQRVYAEITVGLTRRNHRVGRWQVAVAFVVAAAALVPAAVAVGRIAGVFGSHAPTLPASADRAHVSVVIDPRTGRTLAEVAPWKKHNGVCYLVVNHGSGCMPRSPRLTSVGWGRFGEWGLTFTQQVTRVVGVRGSGVRVRFRLLTFQPPLNVILFTGGGPAVRRVELLDHRGHLVAAFAQRKHP